MDGIDGIAAVETITVCAGGLVLHRVAGAADGYWIVALVLIAATGGFLVWNWPPAPIFMGDAGSGFLGLMMAALALLAGAAAPALLWGWIILLGAFTVDATVTLVHRVMRGDRFVDAHRTHAYQHAAQRWGHRPITIAFAVINVAWLLPIAIVVVIGRMDGLAGLAVAYSPLVAAAIWFDAGRPAERTARIY
jgi:Fuc2NAc and GlcNAc transferase